MRQDLTMKIEASESKGRNQLVAIVLGYLIALGSGPLAVFLRSRLDRKRLDEKAAEIALAEVNRSFPAIAAQTIQAYLDREIPARVNALMEAAKSHERNAKLRSGTPILVIADDEALAQARAEALRAEGFLDLRTATPETFEGLGSERIIFIEHPSHEEAYQHLNNRFLQRMVTLVGQEPTKGMFFFIPFHYERLDFSLLRQKNFANSVAQIPGNLLRLIAQLEQP
jgi:hypothetical protein